MGKQKLHGVKSHRDWREVPDRTNYEAREGARAGRAVREANCQVLSNCGGAAVSTPTQTSADNVFDKSCTGVEQARKEQWDGTVRLWCSFLY